MNNRIIKYSTFLIVLISFLSIGCSKAMYKQSSRFSGDVETYPKDNKEKMDLPGRNITDLQKKKYKEELKNIKLENDSSSYTYDMLLAHCYRKLGEHEKSASLFNSALSKTKDKKIKKNLQKEVVSSYRYAGISSELNKNYRNAFAYYKECNDYCKKYGFGNHIPHSWLEHVKAKIK